MVGATRALHNSRMTLPVAPQHILIIEDQPDALRLMQGLIEALFQTRNHLVATDLLQAQQHLGTRYDLVLCDLRLPDGLSLTWLAEYRQRHPQVWIVVSTLFDDDDLVFASLRAGADGYLLKTDPPDVLLDTFQRLMRGEPPISPTIARKVMLHFRQGVTPVAPAPESERLTPREQEVLSLIAQGMSAKMVAAELSTSRYTVNDQIKSIYRKLGIGNRSEATAQAVRLGLVQVGEQGELGPRHGSVPSR
jgi:DNA-binding NarL/FixJ family response regulator